MNLPPGGSGRSVGVALRHLRGFWFSRKLGGDEGQAGALADGRPGVDGLGAVGRQNPAVLPDAAGDGQPSLVPHGFCEGQLRRTDTNKRLVLLRGSGSGHLEERLQTGVTARHQRRSVRNGRRVPGV